MKKNINNIVTIVIFLSIIFLLPVSFYIFRDYISVTNTENRELYKKPEFKLSNIINFPKEYDNYYSDNLPYRNIIQETWAYINFMLFNDTINNKVIIGKNDGEKSLTWLFYKGSGDVNDGDPIKQVQGVTEYNMKAQENILRVINENTETLNKKDIKLFYTIIPNKENIYRENLPSTIKIFDKQSKTDKLIDWLNNYKKINNLIDVRNELVSAKEKEQVYYKQDTHWNNYGSFIGFKKIMNIMEPDYINFDVNIIELEPQISCRDLVYSSKITNVLVDSEIKVEFLEKNNYTMEKENKTNKVLEITKCNEAAINKTLFIVGDSFREWLLPYFAKVYQKVICLHRDDYTSKMLDEYKPDIVLCEFVERYSDSIEKFKLK